MALSREVQSRVGYSLDSPLRYLLVVGSRNVVVVAVIGTDGALRTGIGSHRQR